MPRIKGTWRPLMMTLKGNVAVVRRGSVGHRMSAGQCGPGHARLGIALLLVGGLTLPLVLPPEPAWAKQLTVDDQRDGVDANLEDGMCATQGVIKPKCTLRAAVQQANQ